MRYAGQVATESEKTTYILPRKKIPGRQDENNNSTSKNRSQKSKKITHPKGKREKKKQFRQRSNKKQEIKAGNTKENAQFFADFRLARFSRGVKQR